MAVIIEIIVIIIHALQQHCNHGNVKKNLENVRKAMQWYRLSFYRYGLNITTAKTPLQVLTALKTNLGPMWLKEKYSVKCKCFTKQVGGFKNPQGATGKGKVCF